MPSPQWHTSSPPQPILPVLCHLHATSMPPLTILHHFYHIQLPSGPLCMRPPPSIVHTPYSNVLSAHTDVAHPRCLPTLAVCPPSLSAHSHRLSTLTVCPPSPSAALTVCRLSTPPSAYLPPSPSTHPRLSCAPDAATAIPIAHTHTTTTCN